MLPTALGASETLYCFFRRKNSRDLGHPWSPLTEKQDRTGGCGDMRAEKLAGVAALALSLICPSAWSCGSVSVFS